MNNINKFLIFVMKNNYNIIENDYLIKYYNRHYEIICKKKNNSNKSKQHCIVIDKRDTKNTIIYNNILIALSKSNIL